MFRVAIVFLVLFSLPAAAGSPQERFRKWWMGPQAKELGLSDQQSSRIDGIFQTSFPRIQTAMQDVENAQQELNRLISGDKTTEMDVVRQLNQVQAARNERDRQYTLMLFRFYQELRPDQRVKVRAMFDARRERERREGRRDEPPQRPPTKK
jgi:Spy/CpxP family protein refolding chaperone